MVFRYFKSGRFVRILQDKGFSITGIDVSEEMIKLASTNHPEHKFIHQDICTWETEEEFDFIVAWDSIFHLPFGMQKPVISKLCHILAKNGVLIYTFGNAYGEHTAQWHDDTFYYSSIGINENIQILIDNRLTLLHLELDQYPEKHVYTIATKP
ncbi:MAG TPA: class I SAM-dependent methyltransferase [Anaerolineae bacterium]|nr:class I SAM-dependent methyltransferase [Anaerolineae bacterium]